MYHFILCVLLASLLNVAIAQSSYPLIGARSTGVGYASSCLADGWSIFNNVAGLNDVKNTETGFAYESVSGFNSFNRMAALVVMPMKFGVAGAGVYRFGDKIYSEQILSVGFANKFGLASLGGRCQYVQYSIEGFGRKTVLSFSFGGIAQLTEWLKFGAYITNISQPKISENETLPSYLVAGICIKASEKVNALLEVEKEIASHSKLKAGVEYQFQKKFIARTGLNINPESAFFGFSFRPSRYQLDYAFSYTPNFLSKHQLSITYFIRTKS